MGILDTLGSLAGKDETHSAYDQMAKSVPPESLADGLSHAFNSDKTPPFSQMVSGLFGNSDPNQKAGLLNQLLGSLDSGQAAKILSSVGLGSLAGAAASGAVTPEQAQQVPPEAVETLAQQAAKKDPSIVDKAAGFYAQHPTLVKAIGAGALALLMSRISSGRRS